ncbi:LuxR C-terminal-related transcriptional regulator, partial [Streptomyces chryseus]
HRATASAAAAKVPLGAIAHFLPSDTDLSDPVAGFESVAKVLGAQRRTAVLVDDLHLLDAASVVLLRQLMDAGLIHLIATIRTGAMTSKAVHALCHDDAVHRVDLSTLSVPHVEQVLRTVLAGPIARRTVAAFHATSGGNALYLRELVLGALAATTLARRNLTWELDDSSLSTTPLLTELIRSRLPAADTTERTVLNVLSLCEPLPVADLEQLVSLANLAELEAVGLVRVVQSGRRTTASLAHPLYGEVLRGDLTGPLRRSLLLQQAERTETYGARRREDPLRIATWRLAATGTAEPSLVKRAAIIARHANDYQQVIDLLETLPQEHHTTATRLLLGEAVFERGQPERAELLLSQAEELAIDEQERVSVTLARTLNLLWFAARPSEALAVNQAAYEAASSPSVRRLLQLNEGYILVASGQPARGIRFLEGLESQAPHQVDDVHTWLRAMSIRSIALSICGQNGQAVECAERGYADTLDFRNSAFVPPVTDQRASMVLALCENGQFSKARAVGESTISCKLSDSAPGPTIWLCLYLGRLEWLAGHMESARRWYRECVDLARNSNHIGGLRQALSGLAATAAVMGHAESAKEIYTDALNYPVLRQLDGEELLGEAWSLASAGRLSDARGILERGAYQAQSTGQVNSEALLLTDVARLGGASVVAGRLIEIAGRCEGRLAPARARFASALAAADPEQLLLAAEELTAIGSDLHAAEAASSAANLFRKAGQGRRATAAMRRAQAAAARCEGAVTPLLAPSKEAAILTVREHEISALAAGGHSSKEIANRLTLSVRTVDNHLQRAYQKLGVTTRRGLREALRGDCSGEGRS